jgi:acetylornithine deacetylase/succinyl-diaminopimelate desuccinylase-like protein
MPARLRFLFCLLLMGTTMSASPARAQGPVDWSKLNAEATEWLAGLLRINTTNPPGNELEAAKYLAAILQREGISAEVLESAKGRGIVVARLRSSAIPDPSRALLLLGHTDVVGVEREKWTVDPFGAVIKDGYLYGRGALDMKGMVIANLAVMVALKRQGAPLTRDVIYLAEGDEEEGGEAGIQFAIDHHWDKIAAGFAINEGGRVLVKDGKVQYVGIQASEKVPVNVTVIASGPSGHASIPRKDNPVVRLAAAVAKIGAYDVAARPNTIARRYFERLAQIEEQEIAKWMRALGTEREAQAIRRISEANPVWNAMLRTTIAPTILTAGIRSNVVPSEARANLNIRLLPGESVLALIEDLKKLAADPQIRFEVAQEGRKPSPPSSIETPLYAEIERAAQQVFPEAVTLPLMSTWATDSAQLRLRHVQCYGLIPFPLTAEEERRMHADDERIPLAAFHKGLEFLFRIVDSFARTP